MRINSLKAAAAATIAAVAITFFGSAAFAGQSAHSAAGTVTRADSTPVQIVQSANDPWD
jgi:hypothetical protein